MSEHRERTDDEWEAALDTDVGETSETYRSPRFAVGTASETKPVALATLPVLAEPTRTGAQARGKSKTSPVPDVTRELRGRGSLVPLYDDLSDPTVIKSPEFVAAKHQARGKRNNDADDFGDAPLTVVEAAEPLAEQVAAALAELSSMTEISEDSEEESGTLPTLSEPLARRTQESAAVPPPNWSDPAELEDEPGWDDWDPDTAASAQSVAGGAARRTAQMVVPALEATSGSWKQWAFVAAAVSTSVVGVIAILFLIVS